MANASPVVVVDRTGLVVFCNAAWKRYQKLLGVPAPYGVGLPYAFTLSFNESTAAERYARATIDQGLEEVLMGIELIYTRECVFRNVLGEIRFRLTITPCKLTNGPGAVIWAEFVSGTGRVELLKPRVKRASLTFDAE